MRRLAEQVVIEIARWLDWVERIFQGHYWHRRYVDLVCRHAALEEARAHEAGRKIKEVVDAGLYRPDPCEVAKAMVWRAKTGLPYCPKRHLNPLLRRHDE